MSMVKLDKATQEAITEAVRASVTEVMELYKEQWVDSKELCRQLPALTPYWLKKNGQRLPRESFGIEKEDGHMTHPRWMYPLNRIKRGVAEGRYRFIV